MAIIYSYQENEDLLNSDMLVGTATTLHNGKVRKITKNFTLGQLKTFINTGDLILSNGGTSGPATLIDNILNIPVYQGQITLTTTGSSGAATLIGNTLNIPQYGGTPSTPTLQQVTTAGNTTSNSVIVSNGAGSLITVSNNGIFFQTSTSHGVIFSNSGFSLVDDLTTQQFSLDFDGLYLKTISGGSGGRIKADLLTSTQRTYQLPDASGTVALTSDIPSAITLTTTGSSGSSTLTAGVLNVPTYTLSGLGGVPTSRTLTINGTAYDLTADRSWSVGTVTSVTATSPITSTGGATPVISTSMATNKLIGRSTAGTGVMEEITIGSGLALSGGTLSSSGSPGSILHGTATGTDTYTVTIAGATAYVDGDAYLVRFTNGNTTGATLNINGLGAIPLYRNNDGQVIGGDIWAGAEMLCVYNSSINVFQCIGTSANSLFAYVTNADSVAITKGQPVYAFGGQGDRLTVKRAFNTSDATSAQTVGVVLTSSIAVNQKGIIIVQGLLDGLNIFPTSTWADGDPVYLGNTAGSVTNIKQYAPNNLVYLGTVTTASNGSSGRWYVRVQNGYELDELHNVQAQSPSLKDTLWYDSGVTPGQWKTASIPTILGYTPFNLPSLTSGSVIFSNGTTLAQDNANFFWDDTNNRLGIGKSNPTQALDVNGVIKTNVGITYNYIPGDIWYTGIAPGGDYEMYNLYISQQALAISLSNNYVGIGTSSPAAKLHVDGNMRLMNSATSVDTITFSNGPQIEANGPVGYFKSGEVYTNTISSNVGIGTSSPTDKLDVNGVIRGVLPDPSGLGGVTAKLLSFSPSPYGLVFRGYTSGAHSIQSQREANDAEMYPLILQPNGNNVGIRTLTPTTELHVNGVITATGGNSTSWNAKQNALLDIASVQDNGIYSTFMNGAISYFLAGIGAATFNNLRINSNFNLSGNTAYFSNNAVQFSTTATAGTLAWQRGVPFYHSGRSLFRFQPNIVSAGARYFVGLSSLYQVSNPTNVEPTTLTQTIGVAKLSTSSNLFIIHNDGTGTATSVDLGVNYPATSNLYIYDIKITSTFAGVFTGVTVRRTTISTGATISTDYTVPGDYPSVGINPALWITNNATATANSLYYFGAIGYNTTI